MNLRWWLQLILTFVEIAGAFIWIENFFEKRKSKAGRIFTIAGIVMLTALTVYQRRFAMYSRWYLILCCLLLLLFFCVVFKGKKTKMFLMVFLYLSTIYCLDLFMTITISVYTIDYDFFRYEQFTLGWGRILIYSVSRGIISLILLYTYFHREKIQELYILSFRLFYILSAVEYFSLFSCDRVLDKAEAVNAIGYWQLFILVYFFLIILFIILYAYLKKNSVMEIMQTKNELILNSYRQNLLMWQQKDSIYHDMKNHLIVMEGFIKEGQTDKMDKYMEKLIISFSCEDRIKRTGRQIMDYLLQEKIEEAKGKKIKIREKISIIREKMEVETETELCMLLGNLWDNAIEACERISTSRWIIFSLGHQGNALFITMENGCHPDTERKGIRTRKPDKELHGIGMQRIQYIVNKYHGIIDWTYNKDIFTVNITIFI